MGLVAQSSRSASVLADALEAERLLRADGDAEAAGLAGVRLRRIGRLPVVRPALQLAEERQRREVGVVHAPHLEDVVGADLDAVRLALAARPVDHRPERRRL